MKCLAFGLLFVAVVYSTELSLKETTKDKSTQVNVTESERENIETVSIDVRRVEVDRDQNGGFEDARILKVNIRVSVIDGVVHINNTKVEHATVMALHFFAEIDEIGKNREVLQHMMKVPIVIRVLVTEVVQGTANDEIAKALRVEEEIIEINYQAVEQIKVTQLLVKLDSADNELLAKREMTVIELKDSEIHNKPRSEDTHKYPDGRLPYPKLKQPKLPEHPYEVDKSKSSFFSKFCNLPFAARVAIFVLVVLIGLGTFGCCLYVCCCKPPAQGKKIDLKDFDDKFSYDGEFEAPALEHKVPIEKQKLVIDA